MHTEEEENAGTGGFASTSDLGGEGTSASRPSAGKPLAFRFCLHSFFLLFY